MGKIYDLGKMRERSAEYNILIEDTREALKEMGDELFDMAVNIALEMVWKEWSDEQAAGTEIVFTENMLLECGDNNVSTLVNLIDAIEQTIKMLKPAQH
ncbi:MAG TPA: hypothetical protein PK544_02490 [Spirochaetota bacterium]|nr:hypothetical protein [Spirochaetota bacterium]HPJ39477.1 hypothetical protein [Spirochaetota bacterium]HPQ53525.1 hypothetical protein [Spirochaetota bacterium]